MLTRHSASLSDPILLVSDGSLRRVDVLTPFSLSSLSVGIVGLDSLLEPQTSYPYAHVVRTKRSDNI